MNIEEILNGSLYDGGLIVALAALAAFINVFLVYRVMIVRDPVGARIKSLHARMRELREGLAAPRRRRRTKREHGIGMMRQVVNKLNLLRTREATKAHINLMRAGWRSRDSLTLFFFLKLSLPFVLGGAALLLFYVAEVGELSSTGRLALSLAAVVAGAYGPEVIVKNAITKRRKKLQKAIPDAIDLLVICAEAGQSLDPAIGRVAREMARSCPELSDELHLTSIELGLLPDRRQALDNLNKRTDLPSFRGVINTLLQTEKYGTPLAHSLRVLAAEYRNDRMMKAETKAARLPAILTVPMIIFILPPLFIVLIGPAIISVMDNFSTQW